MAMKYNCETEISDRHPELILVSESPFTWQGYLIISHSSSTVHNIHYPRVKLKLVMPNYPTLCNAQLSFGRQITALHSTEFSWEVKKLIESPLSVALFLTQLQLLIDKHMHKTNNKIYTIDSKSINNHLQDVKAALQNPSDVHISCVESFNTIKLSLKDVSLVLQRSNNTEVPWTVISSDLPKIPTLENFEKNITNLSIIMTKFKWQVELLEKTWEQLREIDENCWVIDPMEPKKSHMYRRIHLSQSISVTITIDPLNPTALPGIKFSGCDSEVKRQTNYISNNILNWNSDYSILENLKMLLNIYEFPEQQESIEDDNAIVGNQECSICFFKKSDTDEMPDKICNNEKCMKHYHSTCLSKWLQTKAGNQVVFGHIHGTCPHCKERISCSI